MFTTLSSLIVRDKDLPERAWRLEVLQAVRDGKIYDRLPYEFHDEQNGSGEYVPLRQRKPSVRYGLCKIVVRDVASLLFGERRFPAIESPNQATQDTMAAMCDQNQLNRIMVGAALKGSIGSVAVRLRILRGRVFWDCLETAHLTPEWEPEAPDTLLSVTERYKVRGDGLAERGYSIATDELRTMFWFQRVWDQQDEVWFFPWKVMRQPNDRGPVRDAQRSVHHGLGFVPMVWITNLPGGDQVDGGCTFEPAIETSLEIDYQLSQAGRGLKYQSDPVLMIREPAMSDERQMVRSASNALIVSEKGDAKMLEIGGTAAAAVVDYVRALREMALESISGNRSNADRISAAQSGRAMELLHQPLVWLADTLRPAYGESGLLRMAHMVAQASAVMPLIIKGETVRDIDASDLSLRWGPWFTATHSDKQMLATTLATLRTAGLISRERGVEVADEITEAPDAQAELALIAKDEQASVALAAQMPTAQTKVTQPGAA